MDHDGLTIGEYEEKDLVEILQIENDSFPTPWSPGLFRSETHNPISRVMVGRTLEKQGRAVAGYIVFWRVADEIHLHNIAVRRDLRRRGIGSRLLSRVFCDYPAQGARLVTLEVRCSNRAALSFYERFGFTVRGRRPGYYGDTGEDALIMTADMGRIPPGEAPPPDPNGDRNESSI